MKYIKQFEKFEPIFSVNDYVILNIKNNNTLKNFIADNVEYINPFDGIDLDEVDIIVKIVSMNKSIAYPYNVSFWNDQGITVNRSEILRKATEEEIIEFETKNSTLKYNL